MLGAFREATFSLQRTEERIQMAALNLRELNAAQASPPTMVSPEVSALLTKVLAEARLAMRHDLDMAEGCLDRVESIWAGAHSPTIGDASGVHRTGGLARWQVSRVKRYIEDYLSERFNIAELAALVRLSDSHFARAAKISLG